MVSMVSVDTFRVSVVEESVRGSALGAIGMVTGFATALATPVVGYLKQFSPMVPFWVALRAAVGSGRSPTRGSTSRPRPAGCARPGSGLRWRSAAF
jgi:hypothetical protein